MTVIADTVAPGSVVGVAGEPAAIQVDLRPTGQTPAPDLGRAQSPAAVRYEPVRLAPLQPMLLVMRAGLPTLTTNNSCTWEDS